MEANQGTPEGTLTGGTTGQIDTPGPWVSQFSDDLKTKDDWAGMRTINDLGKSYLNLKVKASEVDGLKERLDNAIVKPGENATDEEREAFYRSLGKPEKAEDYQFNDVELPENLATIREFDGMFKTLFHEVGLSPAQAASVHRGVIDMVLNQDKRNTELAGQYQEKIKESFRNEWKDSYDGNMSLAVRGMKKAGELAGVSQELETFMNDSKLGDNPLFIKVFHAIGKAIAEDTALGTTGSTLPEEDVPRGPDGRPRLRFPSMEKQ